MKKRFLSCLLVAAAVFALASCKTKPATGGGEQEEKPTTVGVATASNKFKVWCAENAVANTVDLLGQFLEANPEADSFFTIEKVGEGDAANKMVADVTNGADLYCFAQDQLARLVEAGALSEITYGDWVVEQNSAESVAAAKTGSKTYAYPLTADNGYFMYYDKSVITEEQAQTLEGVIAACKAANRPFSMEIDSSAWYIASWFFGAGCQLSFTTDENGKFLSSSDDFDSAKGLVAAKAMYYAYTQLGTLLNQTSNTSEAFAGAKNSAVSVSGMWNYSVAKELLGKNFAVAKLPTFTVDGQTYQMGSFKGYKLMGIKPQTVAARTIVLNAAAKFLTSQESQLSRFDAIGWGPSNVVAANTDRVKNDAAIKALAAQNSCPEAVVQTNIPGCWWTDASNIGGAIKASDGSDAELMKALNDYKTSLNTNLAFPDGLIWVGANQTPKAWTNALATVMTGENGVYTFEVTFDESMSYKGGRITNNKAWDNDKGCTLVKDEASLALIGDGGDDHNIVFKEAGTYEIVYNSNTATITITKK